MKMDYNYRKTSNISHTLVGNKIVDNFELRCSWGIACRRCSNYIFILDLITWLQWIEQKQLHDEPRNI